MSRKKAATVATPTMVETGAAERLWAMLIDNGPFPGAFDWLREQYDWVGAPDFRGESFRLALCRVAAVWAHARLPRTGPNRWPSVENNTGPAQIYLGNLNAARADMQFYMRGLPDWDVFIDSVLRAIDILEYLEALP